MLLPEDQVLPRVPVKAMYLGVAFAVNEEVVTVKPVPSASSAIEKVDIKPPSPA